MQDGRPQTIAGIALYNMTRVNQSFVKSMPSSLGYVVNLGRRVWENDRFSVFPELLLTKNGGANLFSMGSTLSYQFSNIEKDNGVDLNIRHVLTKSSNLSVVVNQPKFDFGVGVEILHYKSARSQRPVIEILLTYRALPHIFNRRKNTKKQRAKGQTSKIQKEKDKKIKDYKNKIDFTKKNGSGKLIGMKKSKVSQMEDSIGEKSLNDTLKQESPLKDNRQLPDTMVQPAHKWDAMIFVNKMLQDLEFEFNSTQLRPSSKGKLREFATLLATMPEQKIKIIGHSDNVGTESGNFLISEQRAIAVKEFLISNGVDVARIATEGHGARSPLYSNSSELGRAKNRRVEFQFYE
jgi:outer membrane protein OmpA-like peptidoglycan-associated protein